MTENTQFEEYEKKTGKIILIIGIIALFIFIFGLVLISGGDNRNVSEDVAPEFVENQNILPEIETSDDPIFLNTDENDESGRKKVIKITPSQVNMQNFILGVDTQNQNIITIGTDGTRRTSPMAML